MIPQSTVLAFIISAVFTLLLPVILLVILGVKGKINWLPMLAGLGAFLIAQILLRMPLLNALSARGWYQDFAKLFFPYALALSLSAGLFEESARLGGAALLKKHRSFKDAVSFGLGHAFCEVIIFMGITNINNIILCLLINSGTSALSPDIAQNAASVLASVRAADIFWGIMERFSAVLFHIFAAVLVFKGVREKKARYYPLAVAAHTVFNLSAVLLARYAGTTATEIALLIFALAAGFYVIKQRNVSGAAAE